MKNYNKYLLLRILYKNLTQTLNLTLANAAVSCRQLKAVFIYVFYRYEELRYWYDCLFYEEELRQYHDYIAAIEEIESRQYHEVCLLPFHHLNHFCIFLVTL